MITNDIINRMGPGPAAYDHLRSLKNLMANNWHGPVIKKPSELDDRVKKKLNVSSSEDLFKQRILRPGPGTYEPETSTFSNSKFNEDHSVNRNNKSGTTIPKY